MNLNKLETEKKELCEGILKKTINEQYEKAKLEYVEDFLRENGLKNDFEILTLLNEAGRPSGIGKCTACADKFKVEVESLVEV